MSRIAAEECPSGESAFLPLLVGVIEDLDVGRLRAEDLLGPFQGVTGGDIRVARLEQEKVAFTLYAVATFLKYFKDTGKLEDTVEDTVEVADSDAVDDTVDVGVVVGLSHWSKYAGQAFVVPSSGAQKLVSRFLHGPAVASRHARHW